MPSNSPRPILTLRVHTTAQPVEFRFEQPFKIGRTPECEVCIQDDYVSRQHAEVLFENGDWWIRDLGSTNGIVLAEARAQQVRLATGTTVRLGAEGPTLTFAIETPANLDSYIDRYFKDGNQPAGEHTMMIRRAYSQVQQTESRKHKRKYGAVIAALAVVAAAIAAYAYYIHYQTKDQIQLARDLFYGMKSMDVDIARLEKLIEDSGNAESRERIAQQRKRRAEMNLNYDRFLDAIHARDARLTPQQRLIVRVARIFGECELDLPPGFVQEVENYITFWRSTGRYAEDIRRAHDNQYVRPIAAEFLSQQLPPQFFYLGMQESDFKPFNSGPPTRYGIAKGMWQFIPKTGAEYGLRIGPLVEFPREDPADDRHDWRKATRAAAHYIKDLYGTDAQASGLLVMACYNWGEGQVLPLVRSMPANPRDRNFWRLLTQHRDRLPKETYDYVFYIVAAAAIGENPRLFGFDFDNPLAQ